MLKHSGNDYRDATFPKSFNKNNKEIIIKSLISLKKYKNMFKLTKKAIRYGRVDRRTDRP